MVFDQFIAVGEIPEKCINLPANCFLQPVQLRHKNMANENDSRSVNMTNKRQFSDITNQHLNQIEEDKAALNRKRSTELIQVLYDIKWIRSFEIGKKTNKQSLKKIRDMLNVIKE
jgi:hypothetical protein